MDVNGQFTAVTLLNKQVATGSGTATVAGVDIRDFIGECKLILSMVGNVGDGSTTNTVSLLESADNTTFSAITDVTFTPVTATTALQSVALDTRKRLRYIQAKHLATGTTGTITTALIMVGQKQVQ
jgi:hypothetical protein